jgi:hypothetical protein
MHDMSLRDGDEDGFVTHGEWRWDRVTRVSGDHDETIMTNEDGKAGFVGKQGWVGGSLEM